MTAVGVDVGGTFTDLAAVAPDGAITAVKVPSVPTDQSDGVLAAMRAWGGTAARFVHGTTVVTNLLLERTGARVVLVATDGFTDLLWLRRQDRAALYDLAAQHPAPLVAPDDVVAARERMGPDGPELALDAAEVARVAAAVAARAPEAVAIVLLHGHAHPAHEERLAAAVAAACPGIPVRRGSEVLPVIREYERMATTVASAYAEPRVAHYLARLADRMAAHGVPDPAVMTSAGGTVPLAQAAARAAALALSGPAGGVVGAAAFARAAGVALALTIDIGGTSADASLVVNGEPLVDAGGTIAGVPIALPRVVVETVSAGGGSVAWRDAGGALRVGPRSAGAHPGPAAFGLGGTEPTVTDAHLVRGTSRARALSGVPLQQERAVAAVDRLAAALGATRDATAAAIVATADAAMARALRRVSVERGVDPRDAALIAFGGGGPLHAVSLAEALGMRRVLIPPHAGVLSAVGLAIAPPAREVIATVLRFADAVADLPARCAALAAAAGPGATRRWWARARYAGQGHELDVPLDPAGDGAAVAAAFAAAHRQRYGFTLDRPVEVVALRHRVSDPGAVPAFGRRGAATWSDAALVDDGGPCEAIVTGPAVIALPDATLAVPPGWAARALPIGGWLVEPA